MRSTLQLRSQLAVIWLLALVAEFAVIARVAAYARLTADGGPPPGGVMVIWGVLALIGIPLSAALVTRMLLREYRDAGRSPRLTE